MKLTSERIPRFTCFKYTGKKYFVDINCQQYIFKK